MRVPRWQNRSYRTTRRSDPRSAAQLDAALAGTTCVVDVGAGTGSHEPAGTFVAVEPSPS